VRVRRCGETALLIETEDVLGWYAALTARPLPGIVDLVPAVRTVLVRHESDFEVMASRLSEVKPLPATEVRADPVTIPARYDGEDLTDVAKATGMSEDEVVTVHTGTEYTVAFTGFAPGFGYLTGLDERLRLPRRDTPRTRVPAGAVAVAGEFTGVYPRPSPGGWHLLGSTTAPLWDPSREPPALLRPGAKVRFEAVDSLSEPSSRATTSVTSGDIEVVHCGPMATVQDTGRPGYAALGVGRSGFADVPSAALANRLVGNVAEAACLELSFGATLKFRKGTRVAVTGAICTMARDGRGEAMNAPFDVHPGQTLVIGPASTGLRAYVAVRGGISAPVTLGSRSTDVLSGLGPDPLAPGMTVPIGNAYAGPPPAVEVAPVRAPSAEDLEVHVLPGPRDDWFTDLGALFSGRYEVTADSNRVGVRLSGPALRRSREGELPTEGMVAGAIQVPPSGEPIVFLADHPVTGGYPVIAVVRAADLPMIAQARPGQMVRFRRSGTPRRSAARSLPGT